MTWRVAVNTSEAEATFKHLEANIAGTGAEKIAARAAATMHSEATGAFITKVDPRTGRGWAPAAPATLASGDFRELLVRSGELSRAIISGHRRTPEGARAFVTTADRVALKAGVHTYGVRARQRRANRSYRRNPGQVLGPRRFIGLSKRGVAELIRFADQVLGQGV